MSYRDYLVSQSGLLVKKSDVESRASGVTVGRLELWPPGSAQADEVARVIDDSGLDVVIVRMSPEDVRVAASLNTDTLVSWQTDTLLYFSIAAESLAAETKSDDLVQMTSGDESDADALIKRIFRGYRNHYSSNPALRKINVVSAYQDWTRTTLGQSGSAVFRYTGSNGAPIGLCVADLGDESYAEILLAGIVPENRGQGAYANMMKMVGASVQAAKKESVVISTQAANIGVMRAWCRLGFLPTITLNTIHVVRRDTLRDSSAEKCRSSTLKIT